MENYKLKSDEVVLYEGEVSLKSQKGHSKLILTNLNIVFINKEKINLNDEKISVLEYPIENIKVYKNIPQVKQKDDNFVELYFIDGEELVYFYSSKEIHEFRKLVFELITGQTTTQRNAKKVKDAIALVDDTLGINTVQATGNIIKNTVGGIGGAIGKIGKTLLSGKKND